MAIKKLFCEDGGPQCCTAVGPSPCTLEGKQPKITLSVVHVQICIIYIYIYVHIVYINTHIHCDPVFSTGNISPLQLEELEKEAGRVCKGHA